MSAADPQVRAPTAERIRFAAQAMIGWTHARTPPLVRSGIAGIPLRRMAALAADSPG
jgi:hypothetical protein